MNIGNKDFKFRMLKKEEKQASEECFRPQQAAAAEAQFPFYFRRGAVRRGSNIKHQNSLWKMTLINNKRIKDHYVHALPENRTLLGYACKNRRAGNMAEIAFWKQVRKKMFHGLDFDRQKVIGNYIVDFFVNMMSCSM